jgi:hypothetical protein
MKVYVVTEFGCNSSYNDMYPPYTKVFIDRDKAYEYYFQCVKPLIEASQLHDKYCNCGVPIQNYKNKDSECVIQEGGDDGAKRPLGIKIEEKEIE